MVWIKQLTGINERLEELKGFLKVATVSRSSQQRRRKGVAIKLISVNGWRVNKETYEMTTRLADLSLNSSWRPFKNS
jgi:hypothetical protein